MNPVLRCKVRVSQVTRSIQADGTVESETVHLNAIFGSSIGRLDPPSANCSITINDPSMHGMLTRGHEFYIDFTPASER